MSMLEKACYIVAIHLLALSMLVAWLASPGG